MKCSFLLIFLCSVYGYTSAQTENPPFQHPSDSIFTKVEYESSFPGGVPGWGRFLQEHLVYPKKAIRKTIQGTVITRFIVDTDGTVSNIEAIDGPELLREAAIDVIKQSPNWKPAQQYGKKVKSYKIQPITFKIQ